MFMDLSGVFYGNVGELSSWFIMSAFGYYGSSADFP